MTKPAKPGLFGRIAPLYALFFNYQRWSHGRALDIADRAIGMRGYRTVLDVGCGTGALCAAWKQHGYAATGVDREAKMKRREPSPVTKRTVPGVAALRSPALRRYGPPSPALLTLLFSVTSLLQNYRGPQRLR